MQSDESIIFLTGDLGFGSFEIIQERFPNRFYNMGIAEQNMVGTACGLSMSGKKVIIYSIANFVTLRVIEQIRNYLIYHNNHVLIVNGGGGFCYGVLGYTHHAVEDISVMKSLPYIRLFAPCEDNGVRLSIDKWLNSKQTCYLRLEKMGLDQLLSSTDVVATDYGLLIGENKSRNYIIGYGTIINEAIKARDKLHVANINVSIIVLTELGHLPQQIYDMLDGADTVVFLEENSQNGGMGEHFMASCMLKGLKISRPSILGVKDYISDTIGDQEYLRKIHKLSTEFIIQCFEGKHA